MATLIPTPMIIEAAGNKPKIIKEYIGRVNSTTDNASVARMNSPQGWVEPGQTPSFDEHTLVIAGTLRVTTQESKFDVAAGQAVIAHKGEWVQYSSPHEGGADYVAVCVPAFSPETVKRDD
jgi:mannose-6-phosphate isomerase-like protein (cupin superfamily)